MHHAPLIRSLTLLALTLTVAASGGCSAQPTLASWEKSVAKYVRDQGKGDPIVLRDMTVPEDGRPGFAVIGHHDTRQSVDVNGVLLGHERVGGRRWFVYLVGVVEQERVSDIRLIAVSMHDGKATWERGQEFERSLAAYRAHGVDQARQRFPDGKGLSPRYTGFPRADDVFKLARSNGKLVATHEASGARWGLALPPDRH